MSTKKAVDAAIKAMWGDFDKTPEGQLFDRVAKLESIVKHLGVDPKLVDKRPHD